MVRGDGNIAVSESENEIGDGDEAEDELDKLQREVKSLQIEVSDLKRVHDNWFE